jgi:hypothetical protein
MNKFICSILKFFVFTAIIYLLLLIIWTGFLPTAFTKNINYRIGSFGFTYTRLKEAKETKNIDILFLGSSHTYRGFDTRIFKEAGFKTFNLGSSAQTPVQTELLLAKFLDSLKPKIIILEVSPMIFSLDGIESSLDIISNVDNDYKTIRFAIQQNHLKVYNTLLYSLYRELIFNEKSKYIENRTKGVDTYINGGFVQKKMKFYKFIDLEKQQWTFNPKQLEAFKKIITIIAKKKIKVLLVQPPITKSLYNSYENTERFDNEMKKYSTYFNYNEILQLNDSVHFYDADHLNQNGVRVFNNAILKMLENKK